MRQADATPAAAEGTQDRPIYQLLRLLKAEYEDGLITAAERDGWLSQASDLRTDAEADAVVAEYLARRGGRFHRLLFRPAYR